MDTASYHSHARTRVEIYAARFAIEHALQIDLIAMPLYVDSVGKVFFAQPKASAILIVVAKCRGSCQTSDEYSRKTFQVALVLVFNRFGFQVGVLGVCRPVPCCLKSF